MDFELDSRQQNAWEVFVAGRNVALLGRAGCGKSAVMREAIWHAQRSLASNHVAVMAWTTHAASLLGGTTLHKFLSVGIAELSKEAILTNVKGNTFARARISQVKAIFIDEVPQFPARWLTVLKHVVQLLVPPGSQGRPWGGVQVLGT